MDMQGVLNCMRAAAAALAEFRHVVPAHACGAHAHIVEARRHVERAIEMLEGTSTTMSRRRNGAA